MIGTDLFQLLTLVLLFLTLITLLGALSVLNAIKRELTSGSPGRGFETATDTSLAAAGTSYGSEPQVATQAATAYTPTSSYEPTPSYEPVTSTYEPLSSSSPVTQEPEVETGFVSMSEAVTGASTQSTTPESGFATTQLRGDEPEEQPFERDGRWWFKRGAELLVYDEGTGQWVAPPGAGAAVTPADTTSFATTSTATQSDAGEGWKCSSCGAINGSTATSCRLCFAPR